VSPPRQGKSDIRHYIGVDKFLERQHAARAEKDRRDHILLRNKNSGNIQISMAKKKMTIPKNPNLSAY